MYELLVISLIVMIVGLAGTVVPGLPGMPLVLGGIALFAVGTGFEVIGAWQLAVFVLLGLVGMVLEFLGSMIGAKRFGATRVGLIGALLGLVPGLLLLGPFGLVLGPLIGAVIAEALQGREAAAALRSGVGVVVGYLFGAVAEVVLAVIMVGWFLASTWGLLFGDGLPLGPAI